MIIEPGKRDKASDPGTFRQRLEQTGEKLSQLPIALGILAMGLFVYIRNAASADEVLSPPGDTIGQTEAESIVDRSPAALQQFASPPTEHAAEKHSGAVDIGSWSLSFLPDELPAVSFTNATTSGTLSMRPFLPTAFGIAPSNDNASSPPTGARPNARDASGPRGVSQSVGSTAADQGPTVGKTVEPASGSASTAPGTPNTTPSVQPARTNHAPLPGGPLRLNDMLAGQALLIGLSDLIADAIDPDGDTLAVSDLVASQGSLQPTTDGWRFVAQGASGDVTFSYNISDGFASVSQVASLRVVPLTLAATSAGGPIIGTPENDEIEAGDGNDVVAAMAGDDVVWAGPGSDIIWGEAGNDTLHGEAGDDILFGGDGKDLLAGGAGNDILFGDAGNDIVFGNEGDDYLDGGTGDDLLFGGAGNDRLGGGSGNDWFAPGLGDDQIDGGTGDDVLDYGSADGGLTIDLVHQTVFGDVDGHDDFAAIERIIGSIYHDTILLAEMPMTVAGGGGDDLYVVLTGAPAASVVTIMDFEVGDRLRLRGFDFAESSWSDDDLFAVTYVNDQDEPNLPIRAREEWSDGAAFTVVEARGDDDHFVAMVSLSGQHQLYVIPNIVV